MLYNIKGNFKLARPDGVQRIIELNAHISDFQSYLQDMTYQQNMQANHLKVVQIRLLDRIESFRGVLGTTEALLRCGSNDDSNRLTDSVSLEKEGNLL